MCELHNIILLQKVIFFSNAFGHNKSSCLNSYLFIYLYITHLCIFKHYKEIIMQNIDVVSDKAKYVNAAHCARTIIADLQYRIIT